MLDITLRHSLSTATGQVPLKVDFRVRAGQIVALTGPSGAGKTTLLRLLAGLVRPQVGIIKVGNETWLDTEKKIQVPPQQRRVGFVFQDYALFPHLTVRQNLTFALEKGQNPAVVDELLSQTELGQLAHRKPAQLSGGQQQRVALARALVRQLAEPSVAGPRVLLLDEPLSALDRDMRLRLQELLLQWHRRYQLTIILVTHDLAELFRLADHVLVLEEGKLVREGSPAAVYAQAAEAEGPGLYGEVLACRVEADHALVQALMQGAIHNLRLPRHLAESMTPGRAFWLRYSVEAPIVEWIK
nr:ATP-binding cassette domain-containing protein [Rhabdobacter roseus]